MLTRTTAAALLVATVVGAQPAAGAAGDAAALLRKVDARYRAVTSLRAEFLQRERVAALGVVREYRGTVAFRRPGLMRWDYLSGPLRTAVADGTNLWLHYPEEGTVHRLPFGRAELARSPVAVLFDRSATLEEVFTAAAAGPAGEGLVRLELRPRVAGSQPGSVALLVRPADGSVAGTVVADAYGNVTEITLDRPAEGVDLEDGLFVFRVPPGSQVQEP